MCNKTGRAIADPAFRLININLHPAFYVFPPLLEVFLEAEVVLAAEPEDVSVVAEPEVVVAAEPEVAFWLLNLRLSVWCLLNLRSLLILLLPLLS